MDEIDRLIIQVEGEEKIRGLNKELDRQNKLFQSTIDLYKKGVIADDQYASAMRGRARQVQAINDEIDAINKSLGRGTAAVGSSGRASQGLQNLAYAIQDFTSTSGGLAQKMNSVTNNLQAIAVSMGIGGGLFLGVTGAIQAIQLFASNWDAIEGWLSGVDSAELEGIAKKAEELKAKGKEMESALQRIREQEAQSGDSPDVAAAVKRAEMQAGGIDKVNAAVAGQMTAQSPELAAALAAVKKAQAERDAARKALDEAPLDEDGRTAYHARLGGAESALKRAQDAAAAARQEVGAQALDLIERARRGDPDAAREMARRFPNSLFAFATPEELAVQQQRQAKADADAKEAERLAKEQAAAEARVGRPAPARGAAADAVRDMKRDAERKARQAERDAADAPREQARTLREQAAARDAVETRQIQGIAGREFGADIDDSGAKQALAEAREYVRLGFQPMEAALVAINNLLRAQAQAAQQFTQQFQQLGGQAAMMQQQFQGGAASGGFSGMPRMW